MFLVHKLQKLNGSFMQLYELNEQSTNVLMSNILDPNNPLVGVNLIFILSAIVLGGAFFIAFSGFVKYSIILNVLKNAIGTQQIPPNIVVNLLACLMALNVIYPLISPGLIEIENKYFSKQHEVTVFSSSNLETNNEDSVYEVVKNFFSYFPELKNAMEIKENRLSELVDVPNYIRDSGNETMRLLISSLLLDIYEGFEIAIKLYLVFVSIDFLVAVILNAAGMAMLSPTVISTPLKLAIFYYSDSWTLLFEIIN